MIGRLLANKLSEGWGRPIVVDNRSGATGLIAVEMLAKADPDGYTLGMFTMTNLIAMLMYQKYMLATELGAVSVAHAFGPLGLADVVSFTLVENRASRRVMEKLGFEYEREVEHAGLPHVLYRLRTSSPRPPVS